MGITNILKGEVNHVNWIKIGNSAAATIATNAGNIKGSTGTILRNQIWESVAIKKHHNRVANSTEQPTVPGEMPVRKWKLNTNQVIVLKGTDNSSKHQPTNDGNTQVQLLLNNSGFHVTSEKIFKISVST